MKGLSNEAAPIINKFIPDDIPRCIECNLISSLNLQYIKGEPTIIYFCENNHNGKISLKDYIIKCKNFSLSKEICKECGKSQKEIKGDFQFCSQCGKFLCYACQLNHPKENHSLTIINRYDALCKIHSNLFCFYCLDCKKHLCIFCYDKHKNHKNINLSDFSFSENSKEKLEKEIQDLESKILNLEILKKNIISLIDKLMNSNELEIKFIKTLLYTYQYEEKQKNLNYYVLENLKNFNKLLAINQNDFLNEVYKEGNNYISLLNKKLNLDKQINQFSNNFQTLKYHTRRINYLGILKDGRLVSYSNDKTINIYKKNTFEIQLSIKEDSNNIVWFTQLKDERLITCSPENIKIIKLLEDNKYQIDQILKDHTEGARKIIEIKENELISVSYDKTMKIWKLNNENKFECKKTITFQNQKSCCSILKLNEKEFVTSSCDEKIIKFWKSEDYSNIINIGDIETFWGSQILCLINDDILCIGSKNSKGFFLIKISTHQIIKNIIGIQCVNSIYKCSDGLILCSIIDNNGNYNLVKYKYEGEDLKKIAEKVKAHDSEICSSIELENGVIASGGYDFLIKLWL